jgi:iron complex transport system ATP-binding protein
MALAQGTDLLLLDEPTTFLDLAHQIDILDLVERLHAEAGRTVIMVLHDLNMAARYAQQLIAMRAGKIIAQGPARDVITEPLLRQVFELDAQVLTDPIAGTPLVVPVSRHNQKTTDSEVPVTSLASTY